MNKDEILNLWFHFRTKVGQVIHVEQNANGTTEFVLEKRKDTPIRI